MEGTGAYDIASDENQDVKKVLGIIWQLARLHSHKFRGTRAEWNVLDWVANHTPTFNDIKYTDGTFLVRLCGLIDPSTVDDLRTEEKPTEDKEPYEKVAITTSLTLL